MSSDPFVAESAAPSWHAGTGVISSIATVSDEMQAGDWVAGGLATGSAAIAVAETAVDPFGAAVAAGIGFILEHLEPLRTWLNDLTGDAAAVAAQGDTMTNVATALATEAADLAKMVTRDIGEQAGETVAAYQALMQDLTAGLNALAMSSQAAADAILVASGIVLVVHNMVRDAIASIVATAIEQAALLILTLGAATSVTIAMVSAKVAMWTAKLGKTIKELIDSVTGLLTLISDLLTFLWQYQNQVANW